VRVSWWKASVLSALPVLIGINIIVSPIISAFAFESLVCECFESDVSYLVPDLSVECGPCDHTSYRFSVPLTRWRDALNSSLHGRNTSIAWHTTPEFDEVTYVAASAIAVHPIGGMLVSAYLLWHARKDLQTHNTTPLTDALNILCAEYESHLFFFELNIMLKKFLLLGVAVIINPGTISQLTFALFVAIFDQLLVNAIGPYRWEDDDRMAGLCSFAVVLIFILAVNVRVENALKNLELPPTARSKLSRPPHRAAV